MRNVCAEYESDDFLLCCRTGELMRHGYYMTRNRAFLCEDALPGETYERSEWTVILPRRFVEEVEEVMSEHKYSIWYLSAAPSEPMGAEKGRWMVERMIRWDADPYGIPRLDAKRRASEIAEALDGRVCISTLMTVSEVCDPPNAYTMRMMQRTRTPGVCLLKNDGSGDNVSYYRCDGTVGIMATVMLPP